MDPSHIFVEERALDRPSIVEMGTEQCFLVRQLKGAISIYLVLLNKS
jgi:hypothetical protein